MAITATKRSLPKHTTEKSSKSNRSNSRNTPVTFVTLLLCYFFPTFAPMKERLRITLGIVVWGLLLGTFIVVGIGKLHELDNTSATPHVTTEENINTQEYQANTQGVESYYLQRVIAEDVGLDSEHLTRIDSIIDSSISSGCTPGCVVGIVRHGKLAYAKAYGAEEYGAEARAMSLDTRFDIASLTKPIATATAVMQLVEQGRLPLSSAVYRYIPGFEGWFAKGDSDTTHLRIRHLLAHCSGLPPYTTVERLLREYPTAKCADKELLINYTAHCERRFEPESETMYSCLNYIVLGEIVERITGTKLDSYVENNIFIPLGMLSTSYQPSVASDTPIAPTTDECGDMLRGVAHDPLTRKVMGGVSGNAGLFSTLDDIAIYSAMLLNDGEWRGRRILSPRSVATMFSLPRGATTEERTLCFAKVGGYSGLFGDLSTDTAVGHTGATGTSLYLDPELDMAVIILTNRVLYNSIESGSSVSYATIGELRSAIATIAAAAVRE